MHNKISESENPMTTAKDKACAYTHTYIHIPRIHCESSSSNNETINCLQFHLTTKKYVCKQTVWHTKAVGLLIIHL